MANPFPARSVTRSANWRLTALAANEATVTFVALS
jgi:hypothetical protein